MGDAYSQSHGSLGSTSLSLVERMKAREPEAWERFATLYGHIVLSMCRRAGLQPADRADVFQEVALAVARHLAGFRHDRPGDTFRGWLRTITRTKIVDLFRRRGGQPTGLGGSSAQQWIEGIPDNIEEASGEEVAAVRQLEDVILAHEALRLVRCEFEDRTWQAFWRTVVDRISTAVVADQLGMSPGAVRVAKSRVLRRIRDELGGLIG
ncbi:hypothetical protein LCGC14_2648470 [marine sediment metagenome]|uniref:RNA polymerase sigma-70 region 2 domain-containing protein n=1 Tax=marine sediment metagenome TaxID=412755 RepID=A0A0F8ZVK2_9ZZZZ